MCLTSCSSPESEQQPVASASASSDEKVKAAPEASAASVWIQSLFTAIEDDRKSGTNSESMSYEELKSAFPRAMKVIDAESLGQDKVERLLNDYSQNVATVPEGGHVAIDPKTLSVSDDGTVKIKGADLFVIYKSDSKFVTHKGASMTSDENLDDVFTMTEVGSSWKVTDISF
jgi:hypothetical protein